MLIIAVVIAWFIVSSACAFVIWSACRVAGSCAKREFDYDDEEYAASAGQKAAAPLQDGQEDELGIFGV